MTKFSLRLSVVLLSLSAMHFLHAEQAANDSTIVDYIQSDSQNRVTIHQPIELGERLKETNGDATKGDAVKKNANKNLVGYRIQVFADNNHRTAKKEAQIKERNILSRFPQVGAYLSYKAPAWRLRVGDFRTREEANVMLKQIKKAFPAYAKEMTVVVDRINAAAL